VLRNQTTLNVIGEIPKGSKEERVKEALPILESERVYLIKGEWDEPFVEQCGAFPMAKLKDKVDCLTAALNRITSKRNNVLSYGVMK